MKAGKNSDQTDFQQTTCEEDGELTVDRLKSEPRDHFSSLVSRRKFLEFFGSITVTTMTVSVSSTIPALLAGCATKPKGSVTSAGSSKTAADEAWMKYFIQPSSADEVVVAPGIEMKILVKWQDKISKSGLEFGTNNDYCAFIAKDEKNPTDGMLMINHEHLHPLFVSGFDRRSKKKKTRKQVEIEQKSVGVSLIRFYKDTSSGSPDGSSNSNGSSGSWKIDFDSPLNRRISAEDQIPLVSKHPIANSKIAKGTMANCAGGITPWKTFLTCEENYDGFYGDLDYSKTKASGPPPKRFFHPLNLGWSEFDDQSPAHYGWVVEINPWTGEAKKHTSLGRFSHECATCTLSKSNKAVVYMGDDKESEFLYKFISNSSSSLEDGTLYVAQLESGKWIPIKMDSHPEFKIRFANETEMMVRVREAARLLNATPLARPEDIEINPANQDVIVALTSTAQAGGDFGSLLKIQEDQADPGALTFKSSTWISGGPEAGLSSPDNLAFDRSGNLWCTSDISGSKLNRGAFAKFKNNGLFFIPMHGPRAGQVFQVASAPNDAEFTGPMFTPDGTTLLLSVQHPGETTEDLTKPTSSWPDGPGKVPKSALIALTGKTLEALVNFKGAEGLSV